MFSWLLMSPTCVATLRVVASPAAPLRTHWASSLLAALACMRELSCHSTLRVASRSYASRCALRPTLSLALICSRPWLTLTMLWLLRLFAALALLCFVCLFARGRPMRELCTVWRGLLWIRSRLRELERQPCRLICVCVYGTRGPMFLIKKPPPLSTEQVLILPKS